MVLIATVSVLMNTCREKTKDQGSNVDILDYIREKNCERRDYGCCFVDDDGGCCCSRDGWVGGT